jgi:aspartate/methionine/tyrosine aminotransferase
MTGLAGLRVGYGGFPLSLIEYLWRAKQPYNVSVAAEVAACAALTNPTYLEVLFHLMTNHKTEFSCYYYSHLSCVLGNCLAVFKWGFVSLQSLSSFLLLLCVSV